MSWVRATLSRQLLCRWKFEPESAATAVVPTVVVVLLPVVLTPGWGMKLEVVRW